MDAEWTELPQRRGFCLEYLDDHLPMLTQIRVSLHLASCADCRIYMKQMALVCEVAASFPKPYPTLVTRLRLRQHFVAQYPRLECGDNDL